MIKKNDKEKKEELERQIWGGIRRLLYSANQDILSTEEIQEILKNRDIAKADKFLKYFKEQGFLEPIKSRRN